MLLGKHITINHPREHGSLYFNYKKTHSIVLMAIADADYKFVYVDVGCNGRMSDGGVWKRSDLGKALEAGHVELPQTRNLPLSDISSKYFFIGDDAFSLKEYIMKPYSGRGLGPAEGILNYRISRGRRVVENSFGILCKVFPIFYKPLPVRPEKATHIVLAAVGLHNFLQCTNSRASYGSSHNFGYDYAADVSQFFLPMEAVAPGRSTDAAKNMRDNLCHYFNFVNPIPNQDINYLNH